MIRPDIIKLITSNKNIFMHLMKYYFVFFFSIYIQQVYNNSTPAYPQDDASIFQDSNCYKVIF